MGAGTRRARWAGPSADVVTGVLVFVVLVAGAGITAAVSSVRRDQARDEFEARYRVEQVHAIQSIQTGLERYATVLRGAGGFIASSEHVDMAEFVRYGRALALSTNYPGIGRVGFIEPVAWEDRFAFMADLQEQVPGAIDQVDGPPHELAVTTLMTDGPRGVGRDLGIDPIRREALDRARDSGTVVMTRPLSLMIDPRTPPDLLPRSVAMYAPVYDVSDPPQTVEERRAHFVGWTTTAFQIDELVTAFGLVDGGADVRLLVDGTSFEPIQPGPHTRVEPIVVFGQTWRVVFEPGATLGMPSDEWRANVWAGAVSTVALAGMIGLLGTQRARLRRDVSAAVARTEAANREIERDSRFRDALLANLQVGVVATDLEGNVVVYNLDSEGLGDDTHPSDFRGSWSDLLPLRTYAGASVSEERHPMYRALRGARVRQEEYLVHPVGGTDRVVLCNGQPITDAQGSVLGAVVALHDITPLKHAQQRLAELAHHDPLTGLPNRVALMERAHAALVRARQTDEPVAMLFLDLDGFKSVNDDHGHDVGDELLRVAAARLRSAVRPSDVPARLGGDEFVVLCDQYADPTFPEQLVERISAALSRPYPVSGLMLRIDASVGMAVAAPVDDAATLLRRADQAMYRAKLRRRGAPEPPEPSGDLSGSAPHTWVDQTWVDR